MARATPSWIKQLNEHIAKSMKENKDSISYPLATIDSHGSAPAPRVRFVLHRGFVNERRAEDDPASGINPAEDQDGNPLIGEALLSTTDVRGPKGEQLIEHPAAEIAWWLEPVKHQYRIQASAFILPPPGHKLQDKFPGARLAPFEGFDWEAERQRIFKKLSPPLKASFVRPVPGTPVDSPEGADPSTFPKELPTEEEANDEQKKLLQQALANFALIVLEPHNVDVADLGSQPNRRVVYSLEGSDWKSTEVVP